MKLFKHKQQIIDDDPIPYDIPATYGAEYDEYDYFYTKLPSDTAKWQWYYQKCDSCGKYHRFNFESTHYFYCYDGWDSMSYTECWKCKLKAKIYHIKANFKKKIKEKKECRKWMKLLKEKNIPITKEEKSKILTIVKGRG